MNWLVHQALYGYGRGHGLLASSLPIDSRETRELRTVTDMAFDGSSQSYLTCLPVEPLRMQALIRTWPARDAPRPGSVWSHVLLIEYVDLGEMSNMQSLPDLFRAPSVDATGTVDVVAYQSPLTFSPRAVGREVSPATRNAQLAIWATYGRTSQLVVTPEPGAFEPVLLALWEQQWPRLRRSFRFRTRYRVSADHTTAFSPQVVERLERSQQATDVPPDAPSWVSLLAHDLDTPNAELRQFLRKYGAEAAGADAMPPLVRTHQALRDESAPADIIELALRAFPREGDMRTLKADLLGDATSFPGLWSQTEPQRLSLLFDPGSELGATLDEFAVPQRLEALWASDAVSATKLTSKHYSEGVSSWSLALAVAAARYADPDSLTELATSHPGLVLETLNSRPELVSAPPLWSTAVSRAIVLDLLGEASSAQRWSVLNELTQRGDVAAASELLGQEPHLWWAALLAEAEQVDQGLRSPDRAAELLETLLHAAGAGSIGSGPQPEVINSTALLLLSISAPVTEGVWRQASPNAWATASRTIADYKGSRLRQALTVLVAATRAPSTASARRTLWQAAFPQLHRDFGQAPLSQADAAALRAALGASQIGDAQRALREGLVREIRRDEWPAHEVQSMIAAAHPYESDVLQVLSDKKPAKKKKRGWLRELLDQVSP